MDTAAFHAGEAALQAQAGVRERMAAIGANVIRDHMPDPHRELFEKLPTLLVGAIAPEGQPWATMLAGPPGFVRTPDARTLTAAARPGPHDPVDSCLQPGAAVGLLGLEPHTRRRNRMNGRIMHSDAAGFTVAVQQSFGNCPKYIQAREPQWVDRRPGAVQYFGPVLPEAARALVERADTLFIASASARKVGDGRADGLDVSHRGGLPGFVQLDVAGDATRLTIPDYLGNYFFNTLGNLAVWPRAGLLFVDPDGGDMLQLAVETTILQAAGAAEATEAAVAAGRRPGAQRALVCRVRQGRWRPGASPWRWSAPAYSPHLLAFTGPGQGKPEQR